MTHEEVDCDAGAGRRGERGANPVQAKGRAAQAQAGEALTESVSVSPERVRALHDCNARIERFKSYYQMNTPTSIYRSCMREHGEQE